MGPCATQNKMLHIDDGEYSQIYFKSGGTHNLNDPVFLDFGSLWMRFILVLDVCITVKKTSPAFIQDYFVPIFIIAILQNLVLELLPMREVKHSVV